MTEKIVYLMRGLPCCGKSTTAQKLKGDHGIVLETDEYFLKHVGDDVHTYNFDKALMPKAREWIIKRYQTALEKGVSPIVLDRGNSFNQLSYDLATTALQYGYTVTFAEPDSPWWREIRQLLKNKNKNKYKLVNWAKLLEQKSREEPPYHCVAAKDILRIMQSWRDKLTIEDVLTHFSK